jgi:putative (di)nucleoside polyphosphate hydrolase
MNYNSYRPCVIGVICRADKVLVAERTDYPGSWQLPQGGIEDGESPDQAIHREMREELAVDSLEIVATLEEPICYDFPPEMTSKMTMKFKGQRQFWYLLKLADSEIDISKGDGEFRAVRWTSVEDCVGGIVHWKRQAYEKAFSLLRGKGYF